MRFVALEKGGYYVRIAWGKSRLCSEADVLHREPMHTFVHHSLLAPFPTPPTSNAASSSPLVSPSFNSPDMDPVKSQTRSLAIQPLFDLDKVCSQTPVARQCASVLMRSYTMAQLSSEVGIETM